MSLKLNPSKTEFMIMGSKTKLKSRTTDKLTINDVDFNLRDSITSLGCILDKNLSLKAWISNTVRKCNYALHSIYKIGRYLSASNRKTLVNALVLSKIDYMCGLLANLPKTEINKLEKIQREGIRCIYNLRKRDSIRRHYKALGWNTVEHKIKIRCNSIIHKAISGQGPKYIQEMFSNEVQITGVTTRRGTDRLNILEQRPLSEAHRRSIRIHGPKLYNDLPNKVKAKKLAAFKSELKNLYKNT